MKDEELIYQKIGEFVVSFQWLEDKIREIGSVILDSDRTKGILKGLRKISNEKLIDRVHRLFIKALPACDLPAELKRELEDEFNVCVTLLHQLRRYRNRILHSAYIELKVGGEVQAIMRTDRKISINEENGQQIYDQECLRPESFEAKMRTMAEAALKLNHFYIQLIHRYPTGSKQG